MRQPIAILSQHPELAALDKKLDELKISFEERILAVKMETKSQHTPIWDELERILREKNLLPAEYNPSHYSIGIGDGTIFIQNDADDEDNGSNESLKEKLKKIINLL